MTENINATQSNKPALRVESVSGDPKDGRLYETIFNEESTPSLQFVVRDPDGTLTKQSSLQVNGKTISPPVGRLRSIEDRLVLLPSDIEDYGSRSEVLGEIKDFIHRYADLPQMLEDTLAHYILMTWAYDKFSAVPYLRLLGEPDTGKTRILQIAQQLSYRAIALGPGSTTSPLFRLQDRFRGTMILDEADFGKSDMQSDIVKILNGGYLSGTLVTRAGSANSDFEPTSFNVYGPKIIANRARFEDRALETRCLTFNTTERSIRPEVPRQLGDAFYAEGARLRNKLLKWRLTEYHSIKSDESALQGLSGRQTQIGTPIYSVSPDAAFKERFLQYMSEQDAELKAAKPSLLVLEILAAFFDCGHQDVRSKYVAERVQALAGRREMSRYGLQERHVNELALSLGFSKKRTKLGQAIILDKEVMTSVRRRYKRETLPADVLDLMRDDEEAPIAA
jgi:hypothetical protein